MAEYHPEKSKVARSFAAAAQHYDDVAVLQRQTADELLERLDLCRLSPETMLDLGAGTGRNLMLLQQRFPKAELFAMDIAVDMLNQAERRYKKDAGIKRWLPGQQRLKRIAGDAEHIPLRTHSVDLVFANLALQWCEPQRCFQEIQRVLKPGGLLIYTSLGPDTLSELRQAWAEVDDYPHVNLFYDMHDVGDAMTAAGLADCVLDIDKYTLNYDSPMAMMRDLKILGAHNVNAGRRRGLTGKNTMQSVIAAYEQQRVNNMIPASYEVIFGHAWKLTPSQTSHEDGSVSINIRGIS